jgi:ribosomal-protein-alanine N-acetyltransferase
MTDDLTLRPATLRDSQRIATMSRDLIEAGLGWSWTAERVARSLSAPDTCAVVATQESRIVVGFAIMEFREWTSHLSLLAVAPSHRRQGLGRRVVGWLEQSAEVAGIAFVYVEARSRNRAALDFYRRLGYQQIERIRGYYRGREDAVRLARTLCLPLFGRLDTPLPRGLPPRPEVGDSPT